MDELIPPPLSSIKYKGKKHPIMLMPPIKMKYIHRIEFRLIIIFHFAINPASPFIYHYIYWRDLRLPRLKKSKVFFILLLACAYFGRLFLNYP